MNICNCVKTCYFNIFVLFIVDTTSFLKLVFLTVYCFCLDGYFSGCVVAIIATVVVVVVAIYLFIYLFILFFRFFFYSFIYLFIYLLFFLPVRLVFLFLLSMLSSLLLLLLLKSPLPFVRVWLLLLIDSVDKLYNF